MNPVDVPTPEALQRYHDLQTERLAAQRRADALEREAKLLEPLLRDYCATEGNRVDLHGFRLTLETAPGRVSWKDEFLALAGAEAAARLAADAPRRLVFSCAPV